MRTRNFIGIFTCALALTFVGTSDGYSFDKTALKCRGTIVKGFAKANATAEKVLIGCHAGKAKGKVAAGTDCNDVGAADSKGKFAKADGKLRSGIAKKCPASATELLANYLGCSEPCATEESVGAQIDSFTEAGACMACMAGTMAEDHVETLLGSPSGLDKDQGKCHAAIGKGYTKVVAAAAKERTKCQAGQDKAGNHDISGCASYDGKGKIAKAQAKAGSGVDKKCTADHLAAIDSCSSASTGALKDCLGSATTSAGSDLYDSAFGLPALVCPTGLRSVVQAGAGTVTRLDAGWAGMGHDVAVTHQYGFTVNVDCPNDVPPCGNCTITGVDAVASSALVRCKDDTTIPCTNLFGPDSACPNDGTCVPYLGPPLPLSSGGNPVCGLNRMASDITGSANAETGEGVVTVDMKSQVHLGYSLTQPCPLCIGDVSMSDGIKDGTCDSAGPKEGSPCDVIGLHPSFGPSVARGPSLDCPPNPTANISGTGLGIDLALSTGNSSLGFDNACDTPLGFMDCACGTCSGDTQMPCRNDAECASAGTGTCTSMGIGAARAPNSCASQGVPEPLACSATDDDGLYGECTYGPDDKFCDGQLRANGNGYIACNTDADCIAVDSVCDSGDCGDCSMLMRRKCFVDPIKTAGVPDLETPILSGQFCIPPVANVAINGAAGLPGAGRVTIEMETTRLY
jgi:hypothetical protein